MRGFTATHKKQKSARSNQGDEMSLRNAMVTGCATKNIQRIEPMNIATMSTSVEDLMPTIHDTTLQQMNVNIAVRYSRTEGAELAKKMLMRSIYGEVVEKLHGLEYSLRNNMIEEAIQDIKKIRESLI